MADKQVVHVVKQGRCRVEIIRQKGQKDIHYSVRPFREFADPETGDPRRAWNFYERDRPHREKAEAEAWEWIDSSRADATGKADPDVA